VPPHVGAQEKSEEAHQKFSAGACPHLQIASDATASVHTDDKTLHCFIIDVNWWHSMTLDIKQIVTIVKQML